jgi:hypothetical protein
MIRRLLLFVVMAVALAVPAVAAAKVPFSVGTQLDASCSGITVNAQASDPNRIASAKITLSQVNIDGSATPIDGTTFTYSTPLPRQINETWHSSTVLVPGVTYRLLFQVFEKDGSSPLSAGGDFTCNP